MATTKRKKESLRVVAMAYIAGAHYIALEVARAQSMLASANTDRSKEDLSVMLEEDYDRFLQSHQSVDLLCDILEEEDVYPFGSEWPREAIFDLVSKLKGPKLDIESPDEVDCTFKFKKGFKDILADYAHVLEDSGMKSSSLDHWLVVIANTSFFSGAALAAKNAEKPKLYHDVLEHVESETDPWSKYHQINDAIDKQISREAKRKTGLVTDYEYEG